MTMASGAAASPLPPSVEEAYRRKCITLKRRLAEVEENNDSFRLRKVRLNRGIRKMRLERAYLLETLAKRMAKSGSSIDGAAPLDDEETEESSDAPRTPDERPLRSKRSHRRPLASPPPSQANYQISAHPSYQSDAYDNTRAGHPLADAQYRRPSSSAAPPNGHRHHQQPGFSPSPNHHSQRHHPQHPHQQQEPLQHPHHVLASTPSDQAPHHLGSSSHHHHHHSNNNNNPPAPPPASHVSSIPAPQAFLMFFENNYLSQPHKHPGARTEEDLEKLASEHWDAPEYAKQRRMYEAQEEKQRARYAEEGGSRGGGGDGGGYDGGHAAGRQQPSPRAGGGSVGGRTLQPKVERDDDEDDGGVGGGGRGRERNRDEFEMEREREGEEMEGAEKGGSRDEDVEMADSGPGPSGGFTSING